MLHELSQPASADNGESLCRPKELKLIGIPVDQRLCGSPHPVRNFEQSRNRFSKSARDNRAQEE
jgi:hypothetical protein